MAQGNRMTADQLLKALVDRWGWLPRPCAIRFAPKASGDAGLRPLRRVSRLKVGEVQVNAAIALHVEAEALKPQYQDR